MGFNSGFKGLMRARGIVKMCRFFYLLCTALVNFQNLYLGFQCVSSDLYLGVQCVSSDLHLGVQCVSSDLYLGVQCVSSDLSIMLFFIVLLGSGYLIWKHVLFSLLDHEIHLTAFKIFVTTSHKIYHHTIAKDMWLILLRKITPVYSQNCNRLIHIFCYKVVEWFSVKLGGKYRYHFLQGQLSY